MTRDMYNGGLYTSKQWEKMGTRGPQRGRRINTGTQHENTSSEKERCAMTGR